MRRLWQHDCETCLFVGQLGEWDLYLHAGRHESVVARWGDDGPEYCSDINLKLNDLIPIGLWKEAREFAADA